jgi:hypothetical protein
VKIEGVGEGKVKAQRTPTGWHFATPAGLRAQVEGLDDGIICRVAPGADRDVVQLGIGAATSRLCNALYSPAKDTALVFRADGLALEPAARGKGFAVSCAGPLNVTVLDGYLRKHRNLPWFQPMDKSVFPRPPAGWCSWYYYYLDITEDEVLKNTDWLAEHLKPFGCEWVQIDDGWQGRGRGFGSNRDWFVTCEKDFPRGMKFCADYVRSKGFRPGIWCIPFTQSNTERFQREPDLFVHRADGTSPGERTEPLSYDWMPEDDRRFEWAGRYFIDATGKKGHDCLRRLFTMLCDEWGYDYVKIDAQGMMSGFCTEHRPRLANPALDGDRAYRTGLAAMKRVMGKQRFLLNCGHGWASVGLCEGIRIGGDVGLSWQGMLNAITCTMQWLFLNTLAFYTDPDVVCVREPLPLEQAKVWATLLGITGQLLMASDKMYELPDERVELLRRIFPVADIHPMELYPLDASQRPGIFDLKVAKPKVGHWDVVALFNWGEKEPRAFELSPQKLGLAGDRWLCLDAWSGEFLHSGDGKLKTEVPPAACRVVSYWPALGRPQFVGTSRHLTQGADDVESATWNPKKLTLSGVSHVVAGHPYRIRVHVPEGYRVLTACATQSGPLAELTIPSDKGGKVKWQVPFARA